MTASSSRLPKGERRLGGAAVGLVLLFVVWGSGLARGQAPPSPPQTAPTAAPSPAQAPGPIGLPVAPGAEALPEGDEFLTVTATFDRPECTIGDQVTLTLMYEMDPSVSATDPALDLALGTFLVYDQQVGEPRTDEVTGKVVREDTYTVATFTTGEYVLPSFPVGYTRSDETQGTIRTNSTTINVASVLASEEAELIDIRGPVELPRDYTWLWRSLIGLGGVALLLAAVWWYRRRRRAVEAAAARAQDPPHVVAYQRLDELVNSDLLSRNQVKAFYVGLSDIVKSYLDARFSLNLLECTTEEVAEALRRQQMKPAHRNLIMDFLRACDLVKFARYVPERREHQSVVEEAYRLVDETKPAPPPVLEAGTDNAPPAGPPAPPAAAPPPSAP